MATSLIYMPTFRARQQEILVLRSFNFEDHIYPLLEIIKEHDRSRKEEKQKSFEEIYTELINGINSQKVFVDLPVYIRESGSMKDEVIEFSLKVITNPKTRVEYLNKLSPLSKKVIPVISSYLLKTGESDTIKLQFDELSKNFESIAFRLFPQSFNIDFKLVDGLVRASDYVILDLDTIIPFHLSPPLKPLVAALKGFTKCPKVLLRSAINSEIQNVGLDHGNVVFDADNSHIETYKAFGADSFGDYVGIKKDELSAGGSISPGFIYYDATDNQYYGFKAKVKNDLSEFENTIVPDVLASQSTQNMLSSQPPFLTADNKGYQTLLNINTKAESGKSQAKFKRIAMEHYLYCMRQKIRNGIFN